MDTASWVSAWNALLLQLCCVFTEPTAEVWRQIALGWVLPVVFCLYCKPPDCDRARRPDRPTRLRPMGRGRSDPGSQTAVGLREHPRLVQQDRPSSGPAGDGPGDAREGVVRPVRGGGAGADARRPRFDRARSGSPASGVVAASNFTQVEVFSPSSTNSGNRCLCPFRGSVNG